MAKPFSGECEVELGGATYTLRLGIGELEEIDNVTGMGTLALARSLSGADAREPLAKIVLGQALRDKDGKKLPPSRVTQIVHGAGFFEACAAAAKIITAVLVDPNEGNAPAPDGKTVN